MELSPTELIEVKDRSITQPKVILISYNTLPPSERRGSLGHQYRKRPYADLPFSFEYLGKQGDVRAQGRTRERFHPTNVGSEVRTRVLPTTPDVNDISC